MRCIDDDEDDEDEEDDADDECEDACRLLCGTICSSSLQVHSRWSRWHRLQMGFVSQLGGVSDSVLACGLHEGFLPFHLSFATCEAAWSTQ